MTAKDLMAAVLGLPPDQQLQIADSIYERIEGGAQMSDGVRDAWLTEVNRRIDELRAGRAQTTPARQAIAAMRERLATVHEA